MERVGLAVVWGGLAYTLQLNHGGVGNDHRVPDALWAGALAAISGMEAWVKFGAPLLPKYIALSVGGRVFQHLEACEWGLLLGSLAAHRRDTTVLAVGGILTLQSLLIAPHLQRVAKYRIVEALTIKQQASPRQDLSEAEAAILSAYAPQVRGFRAMKWMHVAFVLAEAAKIALLLVGSERLLGWL